MSLVDTHAHLDLLKEPIGQVLQKAHYAGVTEIITIGIDLESSRRAVELAAAYPQVHAVVGMHPHDASKLDGGALREIAELASHPRARPVSISIATCRPGPTRSGLSGPR